MSANIIHGEAFAGSGSILLARVYGTAGTYLTQATTSSITCAVNDITTGSPVSVITPSIVVASVIFDTLQTGGLWTKDSTGYNFRHAMAATAFPTAGHVYEVIYTVTPSSGAVFPLVWRITAK